MENLDQIPSPKTRATFREWRLSFMAGVERRRRDALAILLGAWSTDQAVEFRDHCQEPDQ
jgi:hypothetical protein